MATNPAARDPNPKGTTSKDLEAKIADLLSPIRDLARAWEINIEEVLDEYLKGIENVRITFSNGESSIDFIKAALLIQGTACIYSKKVEYLYALVQNLLQILSSKRTSVSEREDSVRKSRDRRFSENNEFDLIEITSAQNIDCKEAQKERVKKLSLHHKIPPISLIPSDNTDRSPLINKKGELIGTKKDFRINNLPLDAEGGFQFGILDDVSTSGRPSSVENLRGPSLGLPMYEEKVDGDNDSYCHNDDFFAPASPDPSSGPPVMESSPVLDTFLKNLPQTPPRANLEQESREGLVSGRALRKRDIKMETVSAVPVKSKPTLEELLKPVDPYKETKVLEKPIKILRKRVRRKRMDRNATFPPIHKFCEEQYFSSNFKLPRNKVLDASLTGLEPLILENMKKKREILRNQMKRASCFENGQKTSVQENGMENEDEAEEVEDIGPDDNGGDVPGFHFDDDCILSSSPPFEREAFERGPTIKSSQEVGAESQEFVSPSDYIMRLNNDYLENAEKFYHVSDLRLRVKKWEETIQPILAKEEDREPFDMRCYCSRLLGQFQDDSRKQTLPFSNMVQGMEPWQVSRYFLASLQLANNYNVEISTNGELEHGMDTMALTLLSRKQYHEELDEFGCSGSAEPSRTAGAFVRKRKR